MSRRNRDVIMALNGLLRTGLAAASGRGTSTEPGQNDGGDVGSYLPIGWWIVCGLVSVGALWAIVQSVRFIL